MILLFAGTAELRLEMRREEGGYDLVFPFIVSVPRITTPRPHSVDTGSDRIRAFLRREMHAALAVGRLGPGVYRVQHAGETVIDRWNGEAMIGCVGVEHDVNCGWFACPYPPP